MQQKQQTWKVFFVIIIKRQENMSLDSQVPRSIFTMYASKKKYFRKRRRHGQSTLFGRSDVTNTSRECISSDYAF